VTDKNAKKYRDRLHAMAAHLGVTVASLTDQASTPTGGESAGGVSNTPLHLADIGSEAYNQELGATLLENESYLSDEVAAALDRLTHGTYGTCERCNKGIVLERLDALPYARHCVACAGEVQTGRAVNLNDGRPEGWLGDTGHEGSRPTGSPHRIMGRELGGAPNDVHAAGTPGGGTATGGLAGTTIGSGAPDGANLEQAAGGADDEPTDEAEEEKSEAYSGPSGGAIGGSPANKRARGGKVASGTPPVKTRKPPRKG
jgi:DnaK suppressor protein